MKILPHYLEDEGAKCSESISLVQNMGVLSNADAEAISGYMASCAVIDEWLSNIRDPHEHQFNSFQYLVGRRLCMGFIPYTLREKLPGPIA